jgi:hypothetical protein
MLWREFEPYVLPYVSGCPMPVLEHHARLAAIDWCRKTLVMQRELDSELTDGTTNEVDISPPTGMQIVRPLEVTLHGRECTLVTPRLGRSYNRSYCQHDYCYTDDNATLKVYPLQAVDVPVVITAALMPALNTSTGLDDDIALEYANDISLRIIASISSLPDIDKRQQAIDKEAEYLARRMTVAAKVSRGTAAAKLQTPLKTF